jgi:hypothetical protein
MSLLRKNHSRTAHWSVDFVEHLRTVHFALISLSTAIIVLIFGIRDQIPIALTQATQIAELQDRWTDARNALFIQGARLLQLPTEAKSYILLVTVATPGQTSEQVRFILTIPFGGNPAYEPWLLTGLPMESSPRTLADFRSWWNTLHSGITVHLLNSTGVGTNCGSWLFEGLLPGGKITDPMGPLTPMQCHVVSEANTDAANSIFGVASVVPEDLKKPYGSSASVTGHALYARGPAGGKKTLVNVIVFMYGLDFREARVDEKSLQAMFPDWREGTYEVAFHELNSISEDITNIALKSVPARVRDLLPAEEQTIDALGLKIPAANVTKWGLALLVAIQFYFWLHLQEFNRKVAPSSPGRDVAWIGVYSSRLAFGTVLAAASIVPAFALFVLLCHRSADVPVNWSYEVGLTVKVSTGIVGCVLALATAWSLWKLRTNLAAVDNISVPVDST